MQSASLKLNSKTRLICDMTVKTSHPWSDRGALHVFVVDMAKVHQARQADVISHKCHLQLFTA